MADVTDAAQGIVGVIAAAVYPNGIAAASIGNCPIKIYQGWPDPDTLQGDLAAGAVHISVFPRPGDKVSSVMLGDTDWVEDSNNGTTGTSSREVRRQITGMQITIWAATAQQRDPIAKAVDLRLALTPRIVLTDGTTAMLNYVNQIQDDKQQKSNIYRRDLIYAADYALLETDAEFAILHTTADFSIGPADTIRGPVHTLNT